MARFFKYLAFFLVLISQIANITVEAGKKYKKSKKAEPEPEPELEQEMEQEMEMENEFENEFENEVRPCEDIDREPTVVIVCQNFMVFVASFSKTFKNFKK